MTALGRLAPSLSKLNLLALISLYLYLSSLLIISLAYQSLEPILVINFLSGILLCLTYFLSGKRNLDDFIATLFIFCIFLFCSAVASIYFNLLGDVQYSGADSGFFFELALGERFENPILFGSNIYDGIGAVNFWKIFYDFFYSIGFVKLPYIGITINTMFVSLSGLFSLKMVKIVYPKDSLRYFRYIFLFCSCSLFMLFASLHLRDAFILFFVTLQSYAWIRFIKLEDLRSFIFLFVVSCLSSYALFYLRAEFFALSIGFTFSFISSYLLTKNLSKFNKSFLFGTFSLLSLLILGFIFNFTSTISDVIAASLVYTEAAGSSGPSLGNDLISSQPLPLRLILGSIALFIMPIPFWSGIEINSIYFLFKSLSAIYFYFIIPLIVLSLYNFISFKKIRNTENYFLLFCILGFTAVVVLTSSENRHIGSFIPLFLLFALIPSLNKIIEIKKLYNFISDFLIVHASYSLFMDFL